MRTLEGQLTIDREPNHEWGKLIVDDRIRRRCFELLGLDMMGFKYPDYEAHVSAFDRKEAQRIPEDFWYEGKWCKFTPTHLRVVNPESWGEVNACIILCVWCEALEHLREDLGFPALMYGEHEFHITIGVSDKKIDGCVDNIVRLFNQYLRDDLDKILTVEIE